MFYGKTSGEGAGAGRGNRNDRFEQMVKQQALIEQKKQEIQARIEADRQKKDLEALGKPRSSVAGQSSSPSSSSTTSQRQSEETVEEEAEDVKPNLVQLKSNVFNNDGSFFEQFKRMQEEEALKKKKEEEEKAAKIPKKIKEEPIEYDDYGNKINNNKPTIKILHPDALTTRSASPNTRPSPVAPMHQRGVPPPNSYYNVPPPPPPPPGKPNQSQNYQQDIKPYFGGKPPGGFQNVPPPPPPPPPPILQGGPPKQFGSFPTPAVRAMAAIIAEEGDHVEETLRMKHQGDPLMWFLYKPDSTEYRTFRILVEEMKADNKTHMYNQAPPPPPQIKFEKFKSEPGDFGFCDRPSFSNTESSSSPNLKREAPTSDGEESEKDRRERKRRSRWGPQATDVPPVGIVAPPELGQPVTVLSSLIPHPVGVDMKLAALAMPGHSSTSGMNLMNMPLMKVESTPGSATLSKLTRASPQLVAYARQAYGRVDLDDDEWKQCEEAYKMNLVFQDIARKKAKDEELERAGKFKHEYDSDEEVDDGGTWEHKQRIKEMEKTRDWAQELTKKAKGKHHIGDFLPPEELAKFMEKYKAVKEGKILDESEYQEYKIQQDNIGFKMLQKMGWSAGEGLGSTGQGIVAPIDKGNVPSDKQGLGVEQPGDLTEEDDEFTAYRKRMMLAYRFRPNPLNNPRRAYY